MEKNIKLSLQIAIIAFTIISILSLPNTKSIQALTADNSNPSSTGISSATNTINSGSRDNSRRIDNRISSTNLIINNSGRNLSAGKLDFTKNVYLTKGDVIEFAIVVKALNKNLKNVTVRDILPSTLIYMNGTTKVNNVKQNDDLVKNGLNIGDLDKGESKTILFKAYSKQAGAANLTYQNKAEVWADGEKMIYNTAALNYGLVYGASTVQTGVKGSIFFPLILSLLSSLILWAYLTFNPKGKLALTTSRTKLRNMSWKLSYLRYRLFK